MGNITQNYLDLDPFKHVGQFYSLRHLVSSVKICKDPAKSTIRVNWMPFRYLAILQILNVSVKKTGAHI